MFLSAFLIGKRHLIEIGTSWNISDGFRKWLQNHTKCYQDIYNWWLGQSEWDEGLVEGISFQSGKPVSSIVKLLELRKMILRGIAGLPGDKWVQFNTFYDSIVPQVETMFPPEGLAINSMILRMLQCLSGLFRQVTIA